MKKFLTDAEKGEKVKVIEILGGKQLIKKLEAIGIVQGSIIKKISNQFMKGPVVLMIGKTQVAIGYGMAKKILVEEIDNGE